MRHTDDEQLKTDLDTEGRLTRRQLLNANGSILATVSYLYDAQGRLQSATQNGTEVTRYAYNAQGQLTQVQSPDGHATELSYNGIGQLLSLTQPGNVTTQLTYTDNGQANGLIDARNNATTVITDDFGNRITHTSADTGTQTWAYDQAGNRIQQTDAEGHTTTYTYDAANRLIEEQTSDGKTVLSYHTTNGLLETITDATSTETFKYNLEGQLTAQTREIDGHRFTTGYAYDPNTQKLTQKTLPDGQVLNYHYYADGQQKSQLRAITTPTFLGFSQKTLIGEIDDDNTDGQTSLTYGNGTKTVTRYNEAGQVVAIENTQALALQYHYDEQGQITGIDLNGSIQTYQYDQLGRLTHADTRLGDYRYDYDAVGNRTEKQHTDQSGNTDTEQYTYAKEGEGNRLIEKSNPTLDEQETLAYNTSGSPTEAGELSYDYNRQQRPTKVYRSTGNLNNKANKNSNSKTLIAEYAYNRFGERIKKVVYSNSKKPKVTYYLYDGHSLTAEANETGKITAQYLYYNNQPFTKLEGKTIYALHTDNLGTPRAATDNKGKLVWQADFSPFGKAQIKTQKITLNLRFPGQYEDAETGKYYNYFRDYDPDTGRYATSDPIGLQGGINTYAYAYSNPIAYVDIDGRKATLSNGLINIQPEDSSVPAVSVPNNVGATGFGPSNLFFHKYNVVTSSKLCANQVRDGLVSSPTPGPDKPATPFGTVNNAGPIFSAGSTNLVMSYIVPSPDNKKFTDVVVNYTIAGSHGLNEGFVLRYGIINSNGTVTIRSYGEGDNFRQAPVLGFIWRPKVTSVWEQNQQQIIQNATPSCTCTTR